MKQSFQRMAFLGFVGCLTLIAMAYHTCPPDPGKREWKEVFSTENPGNKESMTESPADDNGYELTWRGKIFNYFLD